MKKILFLGLLGSLLLLASCGTSTSKSEASASSSTTSTTNETTSVEKTSDTKIKESISSAENSETQGTIDSSVALQDSAESTVTTTSTDSVPPVFTPDQEQALQMLYTSKPELKDPDISFAFFKMIESDYLFKATSISIRQQGGSGTLGFYRVSPQGTVTETDPSGNPY
ncbi:hypothetical protein ACFC4I_13980 [Enterococcus durans]|uniref:hypothetical protein n=1 Tax=Enterococcus durans TaxID=53345 RepID=UPI0035E2DF84